MGLKKDVGPWAFWMTFASVVVSVCPHCFTSATCIPRPLGLLRVHILLDPRLFCCFRTYISFRRFKFTLNCKRKNISKQVVNFHKESSHYTSCLSSNFKHFDSALCSKHRHIDQHTLFFTMMILP